MIQDIVFRKFVYDDYKWNPTIPGNVERLHNDYRLINSYVIKKYDMKNDVEISMNVEKEEINQICSFGTEQIIADIENDFKLCPKGKIFFFTEAMADKYKKMRQRVV